MENVNVFFFPMMAHGHMIPTLDMAKLFSAKPAVKSTIITTPLNAPAFTNSKHDIDIKIIDFPSAAAGLPEGIENLNQCTSQEMLFKFMEGTALLQEPLEKLMEDLRPDCLVADMFFPWATASAAKFGIPRLVFHGTSTFALCAADSVRKYKPYNNVTSDSEPFILPNLPHEIKIIRTQISQSERAETENEFSKMINKVRDSDLESYGVVFNSFLELEPDYVKHYKNVLNSKAWHIGPLSLCNRDIEDKAYRGKETAIDQHDCLKWLDSQEPDSVIYVCFGSVANVSAPQLRQVAMALEALNQPFIWVVRASKYEKHNSNDESWLPEGFEERTHGKGLLIKGWAPQVLILDHEAVGGFVTHCGWNSTLEGISAGVPMVTWPVFAEQFYNEKLVTDVLKIGVGVGVKEWSRLAEGVDKEVVEAAMRRVMVEEQGAEMRKRAKELKEKAKVAVEEGGSSYNDLGALIKELRSLKS
jgi:hypothetical protein